MTSLLLTSLIHQCIPCRGPHPRHRLHRLLVRRRATSDPYMQTRETSLATRTELSTALVCHLLHHKRAAGTSWHGNESPSSYTLCRLSSPFLVGMAMMTRITCGGSVWSKLQLQLQSVHIFPFPSFPVLFPPSLLLGRRLLCKYDAVSCVWPVCAVAYSLTVRLSLVVALCHSLPPLGWEPIDVLL
jgi:hypothetical protein